MTRFILTIGLIGALAPTAARAAPAGDTLKPIHEPADDAPPPPPRTNPPPPPTTPLNPLTEVPPPPEVDPGSPQTWVPSCGVKVGFDSPKTECPENRQQPLAASLDHVDLKPGETAKVALVGVAATSLLKVLGAPPGVTTRLATTGPHRMELTLEAAPTANPSVGALELRSTTPLAVLGIPISVGRALLLPAAAPGTRVAPLAIGTCDETAIGVYATFPAGKQGTVHFTVTGAPAELGAGFDPPSGTAGAGGTVSSTLRLRTTKAPNPFFDVTISADGLPGNSSLVLPIFNGPAMVTGFVPRSGRPPQLANPGTVVTLHGCGFTPVTTVRFGVGHEAVTANVAPDGRSLTVSVPRGGLTGPLSLTTAGRPFYSDMAFRVDSYRRRFGFPFMNDDAFANAAGLWGISEAEVAFGSHMLLFGAVPDPLVFFTLGVADVVLGKLSTGRCVGFADASRRVRDGDREPRSFLFWDGHDESHPPVAAAPADGSVPWDVWHVAGPKASDYVRKDDNARRLALYINGRHLIQLSSEFLDHLLTYYPNSAAALRADLQAALRSGGAVLSMPHAGPSHHTVFVYDVEDVPGGFNIHTYDPNTPYTLKEDTDDQTHSLALLQSMVAIRGEHGVFDDDGIRWTGEINDLTVFKTSDIPSEGTPLFSLSWGGLDMKKTMLLLLGATVHEVLSEGADAVGLPPPQGPQPRGFRPSPPATRTLAVRGGQTMTVMRGAQARSFVFQRAPGQTQTAKVLGPGVGFEVLLPATATGSERFTVDPAAGRLTFRADGSRPAQVRIIKRPATPGVASRKVTVLATGSEDADSTIALDAESGAVEVQHRGAQGSVSIELETVARDGRKLRWSSAKIPAERGEALSLRPDWSALDRKVGTLRRVRASGQATEGPLP